MLENKENRTELGNLGEFGLIDYINEQIQLLQPSTIMGVGDDAAVIDMSDTNTVITTDMLLEGVHFDLSYAPLKHLGYKAVSVNISDLCAMNAKPTHITTSIAVSNRFPLEAIEELYQGILLACKNYHVDLIGGDTCTSKAGLVISVTAIGKGTPDELVYRNGAQLNDLICVSGDLGAAYMGLQLLNREKAVFLDNPQAQPDLEGNDYLLERQLKPEARVDVINKFKEWGIRPTSMIDISDGLASELLHICKSSKKGCQIYEEKIPIDHLTRELAKDFGLDPTVCALNGGEDYELLFTIPLSDYEKINDKGEISVIGHITDASTGASLIDRGEVSHPLVAQGWDAFKQ
jgi:thiamine-monophosphate kinase